MFLRLSKRSKTHILATTQYEMMALWRLRKLCFLVLFFQSVKRYTEFYMAQKYVQRFFMSENVMKNELPFFEFRAVKLTISLHWSLHMLTLIKCRKNSSNVSRYRHLKATVELKFKWKFEALLPNHHKMAVPSNFGNICEKWILFSQYFSTLQISGNFLDPQLQAERVLWSYLCQ